MFDQLLVCPEVNMDNVTNFSQAALQDTIEYHRYLSSHSGTASLMDQKVDKSHVNLR